MPIRRLQSFYDSLLTTVSKTCLTRFTAAKRAQIALACYSIYRDTRKGNKMETTHTLLIDANGHTTGSFYGEEPAVGDIVTVTAQDENGHLIRLTGAVIDVL